MSAVPSVTVEKGSGLFKVARESKAKMKQSEAAKQWLNSYMARGVLHYEARMVAIWSGKTTAAATQEPAAPEAQPTPEPETKSA